MPHRLATVATNTQPSGDGSYGAWGEVLGAGAVERLG